MEEEYNLNIKPVLDTFDRIREILRFEKIELPKIVVVGDQSSGKSSVLESITGVCLPRGQNTVTKCPIVIQMRNVSDISEEYATVRIEGDKNESVQINLKDLNDKIRLTQEELIKKGKCEITDVPIYVYVRKVGCPDLTLYDLPGITYKNENLIDKIRKIILKFTEGQQTLILLVTPANYDLANTEAISLIRKHKDFKDRTIGIITKIDLAVKEKNLYLKIMNNELDLKHNPIVVRNRTQEELDSNEDLREVRQKEMDLIDSTSDLIRLPEESKGTPKLIWRLINMQKDFLLRSKTDIKEQIINKIYSNKEKLESMPRPAETIVEKLDRFKECLFYLTSTFSNYLTGLEVSSDDFNMNIGTRVREKFEYLFVEIQAHHERFFTEDFRNEIYRVIRESRAFDLPNFLESKSFHMIMSKQIASIEKVIHKFIYECSSYIQERLLDINKEAFSNYPILRDAIAIEIKNSIKQQTNEATNLIMELYESEKLTEWTVNPYYMDIISKISFAIEKKKKSIDDKTNLSQGQTNNTNLPSQNSRSENTNLRPLDNVNSIFTLHSLKSNNPQNKLDSESNETEIQINDLGIKEKHLFTKNVIQAHSNDDMNILNIQISCFAYWKVFEKRFVDYCQLIVLKKIVLFYKLQLGLMLEKKFSPSSNTGEVFISEDPFITRKRHELETSIKNLDSAYEKLNLI